MRERSLARTGLNLLLVGIIGTLLAGSFPRTYAQVQARPGRRMPDEGAQHVAEGTPIRSRNLPPTSGPHYPATVEWGVYTEPTPEGYWVHNLEQGGIVLLYNGPEGCAGLVWQLEGLYRSLPPGKHKRVKLIAAPYLNPIGSPAGGHRKRRMTGVDTRAAANNPNQLEADDG